MPTRSGARYHATFSVVDGAECSYDDCPPEGPCRCQACPMCDERWPEHALHCKSPYDCNGEYIGPHCVLCDILLFISGRHRNSPSMGD